MATKTRGRSQSPSRRLRSTSSQSRSPSRSPSRSLSPSGSPQKTKTKIYIKSPKTGRWIIEGGPTYGELLGTSYESKLKTAERRKEGNLSPKKGQGNAGKYSEAEGPFCGPNMTYPVNTKGRYRAAMSYARFSDQPEKIRACARAVAERRGWTK